MASKCTIARWLREIIGQVYMLGGMLIPEGIGAHSTRSMATSKVETAGATPEQIRKEAT